MTQFACSPNPEAMADPGRSFPRVSVIVTTRNEERNIERCLRSIRGQSYSNIEAIVVDNQSSDKTKELALRYTDKVFDKGPERSAQRNYGMMKVASGEFVMFIDADMTLSPRLVEVCVEDMRRRGCAALYVPEIVLGTTFWSEVRRFERGFYDGTPIDAARFYRKDVFERLGGFDESISGPEDWDMDKRARHAGLVKLLDPATLRNHAADSSSELYDFIRTRGVNPDDYGAVIYHDEAEFRLGRYLMKKNYYAESFDRYIAKWGKNDPDIRKQFGFRYRYFGVFFEQGKWARLLTHPVLCLGMYFLRFLVGFVYAARAFGLRRKNPYS